MGEAWASSILGSTVKAARTLWGGRTGGIGSVAVPRGQDLTGSLQSLPGVCRALLLGQEVTFLTNPGKATTDWRASREEIHPLGLDPVGPLSCRGRPLPSS